MARSSVRAIIPPKFNQAAVMDTLQGEVKKFAPFLVKDFDRTVSHWEGDKPRFSPALYVNAKEIRLTIRVLGSEKGRQKWIWLNEGTKPHKIRPKNAKRLRFQTGYSAGSKPGSAFTTRSSASGATVYANEVNHPGTKARDWDLMISKDNQKPFERWMTTAMQVAARASGHGQK